VQQLHLVGFTTDLDGLIFSARRGSKSGGFLVALDERFLSLVREAIRLQTGSELTAGAGDLGSEPAPRRVAPAPASALSPKEIQARLRAGRSVDQVAGEAGVDDEWVLRFATPVLAEQTRVVERALLVNCRAPRKGESGYPVAESVRWNLADKGLLLSPGELAAGWSAYHVRDGSWVIRFRYHSRGREHVAQWEYDLATGALVALNRLGSELGYVEPGRRRRRLTIGEVLAAERSPAPARRDAGSESADEPDDGRPSRTTAKAASRRGPTGARRPARRGRTRPAVKRARAGSANKAASKKTARVKKAAPARTAAPARKAARAKAAPAKRVARRKKAALAKKTARVKKAAPAKRVATRKKVAPAKRVATRKKVAPAKKRAATKKAVPSTRARTAKTVATRKKAAPAKKRAATKKAAGTKNVTTSKKAAPVKRAGKIAMRSTPARASRTRRSPESAAASGRVARRLERTMAASVPVSGPAEGNGTAAGASVTEVVPVRQRPLVAVRRLDSRSRRRFSPTSGQVVPPRPAPLARGDMANTTAVIQAPRAGE
jgi:hypothetical protein